jgi:hypothetical protein
MEKERGILVVHQPKVARVTLAIRNCAYDRKLNTERFPLFRTTGNSLLLL